MTKALVQVRITKMCSVTGNVYTLTLEFDQYMRWKNGELVQQVFPELNADERELLTSGLTPPEFKRIMGPEPGKPV